ncbi:HIT domain-containing protein [bacterium]|nr:HIT domain-containing protein [candidate division CSSED10-310 bacterium]
MKHKEIKFAPWRLKYLQGEGLKGCFICQALQYDPHPDNLVLVKSNLTAVMLNRYPYNNGHIMIVPSAHVSKLQSLELSVLSEMAAWMRISEKILEQTYRCDGFNIGMNIGSAAGAGLDSHLHIHLVPRWKGDTNFMGTVADTRVIPEDLSSTWSRLADQFANRKEHLLS